MQPFDYYQPTDFEEAFELLNSPGAIYPVAGATDLIPQARDEVVKPSAVVDVKHLPGLRDLTTEAIEPCCGCSPGTCLYVGAAVRMNELARADVVRNHWPLLAEAAAAMGNEQVRNRATIGGNICTASPAADTAPALYVLEAQVLVKGPDGDRSIPIASFFVGPKQNALRRGEIVTGLLIPKPPEGTICYHEKLSRRKAGDLSIVSVAVMAFPDNGRYRWRLALGAVGPTPVRSPDSEIILERAEAYDDEVIDRAAAAAYGCASPIADIRSGVAYREAMIVNLTRSAIQQVLAELDTG